MHPHVVMSSSSSTLLLIGASVTSYLTLDGATVYYSVVIIGTAAGIEHLIQ
jgi:hypothetical protein